MELTSRDIEEIKAAARIVDYGKVTINISESSRTLDLIIEKRVKIAKELDTKKVSKKA
jgi:hypothetical protein